MQDLPTNSKDEGRLTLRASIHLIKRSIEDKVYAVSKIYTPHQTLHKG